MGSLVCFREDFSYLSGSFVVFLVVFLVRVSICVFTRWELNMETHVSGAKNVSRDQNTVTPGDFPTWDALQFKHQALS